MTRTDTKLSYSPALEKWGKQFSMELKNVRRWKVKCG